MNKEELLKKIAQRAKVDKKNRLDPRFLTTMGFLAAKGMLRTNQPITLLPNKRLRLEDAIWAGKHVEPRILEVLPAAVLRLGLHFDFQPEQQKELAEVLDHLRQQAQTGPDFLGVPYQKLKVWADLPLLDKRVKTVVEKKVLKTYRLKPEVLMTLKELAEVTGETETELIEKAVLALAKR